MHCLDCRPLSTLAVLDSLAARLSVSTIFNLPEHRGLATIIERITVIAAFDLMLNSKRVSLESYLQARGASVGVIGTILEYQIVTLEGMSRREDTASLIMGLLEEASRIYTDGVPIRRSRFVD
jgi:hypothetical protein